jgi:hypothetical protein
MRSIDGFAASAKKEDRRGGGGGIDVPERGDTRFVVHRGEGR